MKDENNEKEENKINNEKDFSFSCNQITVVTNSGYKIASVDLNKNFFENLLVLEMELEDGFSMEKLFELIKQYSIAIEYYLQNDQSKAKAYQNRMEYLLTNKDTLMQLKRQTDKKNNINADDKEQNIKKEKNKINNKIKLELNSKKGEIKLLQDNINIEDLSKKVSKFLISNNKKDENKDQGKNIINLDLEKQNLSWRERLKSKKKISSDRLTIKPSNVGLGAKLQNFEKIDLKLSPNLSDINMSKNNKKKITPFEELYGKENEENIDLDKIEENKIEEINEDEKEDNKIIEESNKENLNAEKETEKDNNIDQNNKNEIKEENINREDNKEEIKKNENIIIVEEEKEENNLIDKKPEEVLKESKTEEETKDKNEKKDKTTEGIQKQKEQNSNSLEKAMESSKIDSEKKITEEISQTPSAAKRRMSLTEEDLKIKPDEEISTSIESQITSLESIISDLNKKYNNQKEIDNEEEEESEFSSSNKNLINMKTDNVLSNYDKIPTKYKEIYKAIEQRMQTYINEFNQSFYQEIFEQFSSGLKELYEQKYKKYIEIRNEYHNQIKENEYLLEIDDNLSKEKKEEIQQTIESLNEEQQHQIDIVEDEFNKKISDKISEFKMTRFKHNSGIQLLEEQVKLDIYSLINEAF